MLERNDIGLLDEYVGNKVIIQGFIDSVRDQKKMQFLVVRDLTGKVQVVNTKADSKHRCDLIKSLTPESTVTIKGEIVKAPQVKLRGIELRLQDIEVNSIAESPLPLTINSALDSKIDWRQISLRLPENLIIFKVQTTMEQAMRKFWEVRKFIEIHSPKLTGMASESGSELFCIPYFNDWTAYLAQSPQFYKQMAMAAGFERVFEIGPVFRANPSFTSRHDTEFTSVDMEVSWIDSHEDIMRLEEEWLQYVLSTINERHGKEIESLFGVKVVVPEIPFPRITLNDARKELEKLGHLIGEEDDLDPQGERMLSEFVRGRFGHEFVFVTDYPAGVRPFYHMRYNNAPQVTKSFDLLWKGVEITTGAQREHRIDQLRKQAIEQGLQLELLESYLNFFRYGCPPHGGCGVGLTRLLMLLLNRSNVREVTFLYRGPNRLTP